MVSMRMMYQIILLSGMLIASASFIWKSRILPLTTTTQQITPRTAASKLCQSSQWSDFWEEEQSDIQFKEHPKLSRFLQQLPFLEIHNTTDELAQLKNLWDEDDILRENGGYNHIRLGNVSYVEFPDIYNSLLVPHPSRYIIRSFYPQLLRSVFSGEVKLKILKGAPGLGKSLFIFFILLYFLNPRVRDLVGPIERLRSTKYMIYHNNPPHGFTVFNLETKKAYLVANLNDVALSFNYLNTIYVYEPGMTNEYSPLLVPDIPSVCLASKRIQEYAKYAATHYMPMWKLNEARLANKVIRLVSDELLIERFEKIGGVARPLMGIDGLYNEYLEMQQNCIDGYRFYDTFNEGDPFSIVQGHDENTSHFLLHYDVISADFHKYIPRMASELVDKLMSERMTR